MSESGIGRATQSAPAAGGFGFWAAVVLYALLAVGPVTGHYAGQSMNPQSDLAGTTPFDEYFGHELFFYGGSALCAYLLVKRDARARWLALFIATWMALTLLGWVWAWLNHRSVVAWWYLGPKLFGLVLYSVQARYLIVLHRVGALR